MRSTEPIDEREYYNSLLRIRGMQLVMFSYCLFLIPESVIVLGMTILNDFGIISFPTTLKRIIDFLLFNLWVFSLIVGGFIIWYTIRKVPKG